MNIVGIVGSLHPNSLNKQLMQAVIESTDLNISLFTDLAEIPHFSIETHAGLSLGSMGHTGHEPVDDLRAAIREADGVLIATPEYNYSIPGALKDAIDWVTFPSRTEYNPFIGKPVGVMGVSSSGVGTARAQAHLRNILVETGAQVMGKPELLVANGDIEGSKQFIDAYVTAFKRWVHTFAAVNERVRAVA